LSILELKGLGKARWRGVDPAAHVARERRSWEPRASETGATMSRPVCR
jgi:hypothetical protein